PAEARRLAAKLEFHYTPKHASWLNMAELELSVLARQCLSRRIPDAGTLAAGVKAWQDARNPDRGKIAWGVKVGDPRKKMARVAHGADEVIRVSGDAPLGHPVRPAAAHHRRPTDGLPDHRPDEPGRLLRVPRPHPPPERPPLPPVRPGRRPPAHDRHRE